METRKLPKATAALVLGILSIVLCCTGIGGLILGGFALKMTLDDNKLYKEAPDQYDNHGQVKTAMIIAIIGLLLSLYMTVSFGISIYQHGGWEGFKEYLIEEYQRGLEMAQ